MADQKLIVHILGDTKDLIRAFRNSTTAAQRFTVGMGTIVKGAVGFLAVEKGARLAGDAIRAGINEFSESAKVTAQTNAALKSTGAVANVTARQVEALAGSLSRLSGIDDELIQQGENLLLTFKNVRNEVGAGNDVFNRAAKAAVDLSVAGFGSIETTSKQLGKALNDPVRGMTALARAGVTFTESQRDQITALVNTNRSLEAQKLILREVESQVGGSARALGETLPGKLNILRQAFDNIAGTVIARFEPAIKEAADGVVEWLAQTKNQERVQQNLAAATQTVISGAKAFVAVMQTLRSVLEPVVRLVGGLENAIKTLLGVMVATKIASFVTAITGIGTASTVAAGRVAVLRASLQRLALISAIAIPITVFLNREAITREFNKITDSLPFGRGKEVEIKTGASVAELKKLRESFVLLEGAESSQVKAIDALIRKQRELKSKKVTLEVDTKVDGTAARAGRSGPSAAARSITDAIDAMMGGAQKALDDATVKVKRGLNVTAAKEALVKQREAVADLAEKQREIAAKALEALQGRQFKALGLSRAGEEVVPGIENLRKQLASLSDRLAGSDVKSKLTNRLAGVRKILTGQLGKATEETRAAINELFKTIRGEFDNETRKPFLTATRQLDVGAITKGLIVPLADLKELQGRLSPFNTAGLAVAGARGVSGPITTSAGGFNINGPITIVSDDPDDMMRKLQKKAGRTTASTRGRFPGIRSGIG